MILNRVTGLSARMSLRERVMIAGAAFVLLGALGHVQIRAPLLQQRDALLSSIDRHENAVTRVSSARSLNLPAETAGAPIPDIVADTAPRFGLNIRRVEPEGARTRIALEEAAFENLVRWLSSLNTDHGLKIGAIALERRPAPGTVAANLTLER